MFISIPNNNINFSGYKYLHMKMHFVCLIQLALRSNELFVLSLPVRKDSILNIAAH